MAPGSGVILLGLFHTLLRGRHAKSCKVMKRQYGRGNSNEEWRVRERGREGEPVMMKNVG